MGFLLEDSFISVPAVKRVCGLLIVFTNFYIHRSINPFKPNGVKWLHFKVFSAILV